MSAINLRPKLKLVSLAFLQIQMLFVLSPSMSAMEPYRYDIMIQSGQAGIVSVMTATSINDGGMVAAAAQVTGGQSVFVGDGSGLPKNITPGFISANRTFSANVQINNGWDSGGARSGVRRAGV